MPNDADVKPPEPTTSTSDMISTGMDMADPDKQLEQQQAADDSEGPKKSGAKKGGSENKGGSMIEMGMDMAKPETQAAEQEKAESDGGGLSGSNQEMSALPDTNTGGLSLGDDQTSQDYDKIVSEQMEKLPSPEAIAEEAPALAMGI